MPQPDKLELHSLFAKVCQGIGLEPKHVIDCLLTIEDEKDIRDGLFNVMAIRSYLKDWKAKGTPNVSNKPSGYRRHYERLFNRYGRVLCEYCSNLSSNDQCWVKARPPVAKLWHRCEQYDYSGYYKAINPKQQHSKLKSWFYELEEAGCELLKDDKDWLEKSINLTHTQLTEIKECYKVKWLEGMNLESVPYRKQNAGRKSANLWLAKEIFDE